MPGRKFGNTDKPRVRWRWMPDRGRRNRARTQPIPANRPGSRAKPGSDQAKPADQAKPGSDHNNW